MRLALTLLIAGFLILAGCQGAVDPGVVADAPPAPDQEPEAGVFVVDDSAPAELDLDFDPSDYEY